MLIPKHFSLFGRQWTVKNKPRVIYKGESVLGKCDYDSHVIELRSNLKKDLKEQVYYHELVHAILYCLEYHKLSKTEVFVDRVSKALHQAIKTSK